MVNSFNDKFFAFIILQDWLQSKLKVSTFIHILQISSERCVVRINRFKEIIESFNDVDVCFFEGLVKLNKIHIILDALVLTFRVLHVSVVHKNL